MLKGCQRQLVMLKPGENSVFESAWLVLREERADVAYDDMIAEANRIVSGGILPRYKRRRLRSRLWSMLLGVILGGGVATLIFFLMR
ncbi:MAG: hypothetical protein IJC99_06525 [Clostridia bacterium]|nr:hypothetical protein [Clostridia bacterium]